MDPKTLRQQTGRDSREREWSLAEKRIESNCNLRIKQTLTDCLLMLSADETDSSGLIRDGCCVLSRQRQTSQGDTEEEEEEGRDETEQREDEEVSRCGEQTGSDTLTDSRTQLVTS